MKKLTGKISWFGGKDDKTMTSTETLALYPTIKGRHLHYPLFNPFYCAMRWDYKKIGENLVISIPEVLEKLRYAKITIEFKGKMVECLPIDWGPNVKTGRLIDVSKATIKRLDCRTDDMVTVFIPNWIVLV